MVATDDSGSKLRRPVFVLSDRFGENFGIRQAGQKERAIPAPAPGDDINFYQLAIQHSEGLTKDLCFTYVRDMLLRLGEAAKQGKELRLDLCAGHLCMAEREASFEFQGGYGGAAGGAPPGERVSHLDPMLNGRGNQGGVALAMHGHTLDAGSGGRSGGSQLGSQLGSHMGLSASVLNGGGSVLTAEEEMALYGDIDILDPETAAGGGSQVSTRRAAELEVATQQQLAQLLKADQATLGEQTIEELGAQLGARAASLERQLERQKQETDAMEARLKKAVAGGGSSAALVAREAARDAARDAMRAVSETNRQNAGRIAQKAAATKPGSNMDDAALNGLLLEHAGGLSIGRVGASSMHGASTLSKGSKGSSVPRMPPRQSAMADYGPPLLSVGFSAEGPGMSGHVAPAPRPQVPVVRAALSDTSTQKAFVKEQRAARRAE